jgi:hypothetical protein
MPLTFQVTTFTRGYHTQLVLRRARSLLIVVVLLALVSIQASTQPQGAVTSPEQAFGAAIGDDYFLATYRQLETYWQTLDRESDRLSLVDIGRTEEGRTQWMALVTAPENMARLDRYRDISRRLAHADGLTDAEARALAAEGKAVVWIDGGLHADEVLGAQQLIELVYRLVSRDDEETRRILRDVIVLAVHANPDGHDLVADWYMRDRDPRRRKTTGLPRLYQKYAGHDNNRDFYMATQAETVNMNRVLYQEWVPQIVYDHHQPGPPGTVMFAPPFAGPVNYVFDPLVLAGTEMAGAAIHARFAAEAKPGVTMRGGSTYSMWWNGGLRTAAYFHNQIGLLTETIGHPTPGSIPYVPGRRTPSVDLPSPIAPQTWRFSQSVDYSLTANRAVLDFASRHRDALLFNIYQMGRNAIARGSTDTWTPSPHRRLGAVPDPALRDARGYILPADQPDFPTATKFVNALLSSGVIVHRASEDFTVEGTRYPAGSYVVKTAQAFRPHVLDMFEPQQYPDVVPEGGGSPRAPYDSAGWTLAFQMGVTFDRVLEAVDGPFERLAGEASPPPGRLVSPVDAVGYLVSHHQNDAVRAVNRLLEAGAEVYWPRDRGVDGASAGTGMMYVEAPATALPVMRQAAADLGLVFTGVSERPAGAALRLRPVRVGLVDRHGGWSSSGWIRFLLERFDFPFEVVLPDALDAGGLASVYDVLILPSEAAPRHREGGITVAGTVPRLQQFVEDGGTLLAIGKSAAIGAHLGLPVSNPLVERQQDGSMLPLFRDKYYVPGSLLRVAVDNTEPLAYGFEDGVDVFFDNSPVFRLEPGAAARGVRPVAWFAGPAPLRSGWARGQAYLEDAIAVLDAPMGKGRVLLFGPEITFRAQPHGTFKFLFNGIFYGTAEPVRLR